jgi:integration host factor subunit beta
MTKSELIDAIAQSHGLPRNKAEAVVNTVISSISSALVRRDGVEIRGFGSFSVRAYDGYEGRNPKTGEAIAVRPKLLPFFKVGKDLREIVDEGRFSTPDLVEHDTVLSSDEEALSSDEEGEFDDP